MEVSGRRTRGSEEVYNVCDTCQDRRSVTRAVYGYCVECRCYLCEDCYYVHRDPPPSRNHRLLEGKQTPKERLPPVDTCEAHPDEKINYYCREHSSLACQKCAFLKHRACKDVCDISELLSEANIVKRCKELKKKIDELELRTEQNRQTRLQNLSKIDFNTKQAKADIQQFCAAVHERLYELERKTDEEVDQLDVANYKCMDEVQQECDSVSTDLKIVTTMLETSQDPSQKILSYIAVEKVKTITDILDNKLTKLSGDNTVKEYKFKPNDQLECLVTDVEYLGELLPHNMAQGLSLQNLQVNVKQAWALDTVTAEEEDGINVRTQIDKRTCRITGSKVMEGDTTLAVADNNNKSVKLVDLKQKTVIFQLRLADKPWDITQIEHNQLVATLPRAHKVQFVSVTIGTSLSLGRQMNVLGKCCGIAYNDDRLFISFTDPKQVQILSMSGTVLNTISSQTDGQIRFTCPFYLTLSEDRSLLNVNDCVSNVVFCLDMNGVVKATYLDKGLKKPCGACAAKDGSVIVCGGGSHNVYLISPDCKHSRILLDKSHGINLPDSVAYSSVLSTLYIGQEDSDTLKVFKLK